MISSRRVVRTEHGEAGSHRRRGRRTRWVVVAAAVVGLGVLAVLVLVPRVSELSSAADATDAERVASPATPTAVPSAAAEASEPASSSPFPAPAAATRSTTESALLPTRISIPTIDVDASIIELGIAAGGEVEVPSDARQVGWVDTTPAPGQQGSSVVAGHVDSSTGPAVFYELGSLQPGDDIAVTSRDGSVSRFTVDGVETYPKDRFPTARVYGPVPGPVLRLITCGGVFDRSTGHYEDNVVVYAS